MQLIRLLLVEDNPMQREIYAMLLTAQEDIRVIHTADNGVNALQAIQQHRPDVVLFDMVMPQLDGFALLENVHTLPADRQPAMIALTSLGRDDFITRAVALGVDDYLIKPVEPEQLVQRVRTIHQQRQARLAATSSQPEPAPAAHMQHTVVQPQPAPAEAMSADSIRKYAALLLMQLDMPAHLHGYQYMLEAVVLAVQSPSVVNHMTAELYPAVAGQCGATASRVERSIRNAVAITWDRGGGSALNKILGRNTALHADKPSNSELIAQLAARIRMKEAH